MKKCPQCNRTYADESLTFCLADGALLSAPYDPEATQRIYPSRVTNPPPTEVLPKTSSPQISRQASSSNFRYAIVLLLAILITGGLVALFYENRKEASIISNIKPSETPAPTPSRSSSSSKPQVPNQSSNGQIERREWTVVVPGNVRWLDTGIQAQKGMRLVIHATGTVTWGPPGITDGTNVVGPNGTRPPYKGDSALFPMPEAGIGSLIMRIGRVKYAVGSDDTIEVKEDGKLELMVNDDAVGDNSGSFTVHISS